MTWFVLCSQYEMPLVAPCL